MDPRTPVLVGYGQVNQREENPQVEPVDLMVEAARAGADPRVLAAVDSVRVVNLLSWRYRDPGLLLAQRIGADTASTRYTGIGGNTPQSLVNEACLDIQAGRADVVLIAGAETWRTRTKLRRNGIKPDWTRQDDSVAVPPGAEVSVPMAAPSDERIHLDRPSFVYPMFEEAVRISRGEAIDAHRRRIGELWAQFSAVAAANPNAWSREALSAEQIWRESPDNRMISWPYPKLMNSNNMVDQAAALVLTSVEKAEYLQIPKDRWVFPYAGTDAHDTYAIAERDEFHTSPAIRIAGRRVLELAGLGIDDVELVDLYSCFPSAVQVAAAELGLPIGDPGRPLTVTGGLTFAGGPWNNYVTHSIATMAERLVAEPGTRGLISANGGYLTKHSFGVYGTEPPTGEFRWQDVQSEVDREPTRTALVEWSGVGTVETWTTPYNREGVPEKAFLAVRSPEGARALAVITDASQAAATVTEDIAGAKVQVGPDGSAVIL
ncbi:acetyl-CoA acetyltransferase [Mycolicibacterium phlei]|jgi:acetyl-CoA C-acetyltransferase|uniref:Acetyl-CoA acetyltransferase n=1 Tax=Mycolicibacterium phlei DSM 43239 = CCUG 21000 TaxID=1226750 RepID=A0A5N5UVP8_MYCPH|nr:acetyl-CoA acetyltransferase [Mycolicibacterium phlei]VEG09319.1 acetyl-CoA acetyltransferase [Mycobacteroides chelonae]AMO61204.1 acetyl-CoA acetyltransferase [Mycolicibacterium phlei]EID08830.1 acetyl-CoA acetyltransferase [Mycolicibacterium phlei RIVM601174]KAB7752549.1 acetyl-CoA acetyltransferase [Mycolicibacterium phlei DSM 43239 = CCUG 21000]KXW60899.1 acetyl-CoA acetyltransferase [Mycolicibacterium phlei DSM 43239 = CCUG 21000]